MLPQCRQCHTEGKVFFTGVTWWSQIYCTSVIGVACMAQICFTSVASVACEAKICFTSPRVGLLYAAPVTHGG